MRYAMPLLVGRGAGLGNEMMPWAKAFIAGRALGLEVLHPAWGLNSRRYGKYFRTSPFDWAWYAGLRAALPFFEFEENDLAPGEGLHDAVLRFAARRELDRHRNFVLGFSGMWGGMEILTGARAYLLGQLLASRWTIENLYELEHRLDAAKLRVGLHIRRGDFLGPPADLDFRGKFNCAIPIDWYAAIARSLRDHFGDRIEFVVISDAADAELAPLLGEFQCITTRGQQHTDISDLLALARSDLVVCSVSSFSIWAVFLGNLRYIWLAANLDRQDGFASIWGNDCTPLSSAAIREAAAANRQAQAAGQRLDPRGLAVGWDGGLPAGLLEDIDRLLSLKSRSTDLIRYGAVPILPSGRRIEKPD